MNTAPPAPLTSPAPAQKQGFALLAEITCGTQYAALNTAAVGSGLNALSRRWPLQRPLALRNFIPNPPSARLSWGRLMEEMAQPDTVSLPVSGFLTHLAVVEKQVEFICDEIEQRGQSAVVLQHSARMQQAAKQMGQLGIAALHALDSIGAAVGSNHFVRNSVLLRGLLHDVQEGRSPLVDRTGRLQVPELPQRRPPLVKRVSLPCVIECKGKEHRGTVTNISAGGLGVDCAAPLAPRSVIVVEIGERCMSGRVVWQSGRNAGVRLDKALKDDDVLLAD
ncbi:MAG: PilZ domain-containing protein [Hyphomicrobiaceae bacterium]|nr:PilZ domain-containing protein [Hyphomicrobiaceae bacterium]